jgi:hypothetical protein
VLPHATARQRRPHPAQERHAIRAHILQRPLKDHRAVLHAAAHLENQAQTDPVLPPQPGARIVVIHAHARAASRRSPALHDNAAVVLGRDCIVARVLTLRVMHFPLAYPEIELAKGAVVARLRGSVLSARAWPRARVT